jgi:hypothetical protein
MVRYKTNSPVLMGSTLQNMKFGWPVTLRAPFRIRFHISWSWIRILGSCQIILMLDPGPQLCSTNRYMQIVYLLLSASIYVCTCKDAIQCRPWATPPPLSCTSREPISNLFTFLESSRKMNLCGQHFFFVFFWKTLFEEKSKNVLNCGVVALFMQDFVTH